MRAIRRLALLAPLLFSGLPVQAQTAYTLQSIMRLGDPTGDVPPRTANGYFDVGTLNDSGQIIFTAGDADVSESLIQYNGGQLATIVTAGKPSPGGHWAENVLLMPTVRMNQQGNAVFSAGVYVGDTPLFNSHLWEFQSKTVVPLIRPGAQATPEWIFEGASVLPVINNGNEIVLTATLKNQSGTRTGDGIFFRDKSGRFTPVALPGQVLPDGAVIKEAHSPDLNDAGQVAFLVRREGDPPRLWNSYLWANGVVSPLTRVGDAAPGGRVSSVWSVWLNSANGSVLMEASTNVPNSGVGLYRYVGGQLTPLAVPGQSLPGGKLLFENGPSYANALGQHAFLAVHADGSSAAYLIGAAGDVSLVLKSGVTTDLGRITNVGQGTGATMDAGTVRSSGPDAGASFGVGINGQRQLVTTVGIEGGADTLVLLTPP